MIIFYYRPIHGITLLLHHKPERAHRDDGSTTHPNNVYFANQVKFMQRKTNQEITFPCTKTITKLGGSWSLCHLCTAQRLDELQWWNSRFGFRTDQPERIHWWISTNGNVGVNGGDDGWKGKCVSGEDRDLWCMCFFKNPEVFILLFFDHSAQGA